MNPRHNHMWLGRVICLLTLTASIAEAGEKQIVSIRDLSGTQVKDAGFSLTQGAPVHIRALGAGGENSWSKANEEMFAYGWIINAETRDPVWVMTVDNTSKTRDDRTFDGTIDLPPGSYEVYFAAARFSYNSTFTHISVDVDHRKDPLFGEGHKGKKNFFNWLFGWWSDDISKDWYKRSPKWGIDLLVDESVSVSAFPPPQERPNVVLKATGLGENELVRKAFVLSQGATLNVYAVGEGEREGELADHGWIVNTSMRKRVWDMQLRNCTDGGGARKNIRFNGSVTVPKGEYVLYYTTDGTHSTVDWNANPPYDPLNWGVTISIDDEKERRAFSTVPYEEDRNVIVSLVHPKESDFLSQGFTLKTESRLRVYAIGERGNSRRSMADYGTILDARTREKVWTMDVDRTYHAGGAGKNRFIDEIITLPRGSYLVTYVTDDSHTYGDWNADPPFDPEHYGITVMGAGEKWDPSVVSKYVEDRERNILAQIIRPGNDVDLSTPFSLDKPTRIRVYAIGEGVGREMADYGWIEDGRTGRVIWEMTYGMTFYAGGARKNRMVNTTIVLDRGDYRLRYKSDDSHSYGDWNDDPPDDQQYWGITLYRDQSVPGLPGHPNLPNPPEPPEPPDDNDN